MIDLSGIGQSTGGNAESTEATTTAPAPELKTEPSGPRNIAPVPSLRTETPPVDGTDLPVPADGLVEPPKTALMLSAAHRRHFRVTMGLWVVLSFDLGVAVASIAHQRARRTVPDRGALTRVPEDSGPRTARAVDTPPGKSDLGLDRGQFEPAGDPRGPQIPLVPAEDQGPAREGSAALPRSGQNSGTSGPTSDRQPVPQASRSIRSPAASPSPQPGTSAAPPPAPPPRTNDEDPDRVLPPGDL